MFINKASNPQFDEPYEKNEHFQVESFKQEISHL